jgi:hypothetical protein
MLANTAVVAQELSQEQRSRFQQARKCAGEQVTEFDDGTSSAEIVAKAIVNSCKEIIRDRSRPNSPDSLVRFRQEEIMIGALERVAVENVLKSRVKNRQQQSAPTSTRDFALGDIIRPDELSRMEQVSKNYYERNTGRGTAGFRFVPKQAAGLMVISKKFVSSVANLAACSAELTSQTEALRKEGFKFTNRPDSYFEENFSIESAYLGMEFAKGNNRGFLVCWRSASSGYNFERREGLRAEEEAAYVADMREAIEKDKQNQ